jgi:hypothetical protein
MTIPSAFIRRSPRLFYIAAVVMFAWSLGNSYSEMAALDGGAAGLEGYAVLVKSKVLFEASREALWYVSSGVMFEILIAIHDKVKGE